jgi:hypothetical protein
MNKITYFTTLEMTEMTIPCIPKTEKFPFHWRCSALQWQRVRNNSRVLLHAGLSHQLNCIMKTHEVVFHMTNLKTFSSSEQPLLRWLSTSSIKGRSLMLTNDKAVPCNEKHLLIWSQNLPFHKPLPSGSSSIHLKLYRTFLNHFSSERIGNL